MGGGGQDWPALTVLLVPGPWRWAALSAVRCAMWDSPFFSADYEKHLVQLEQNRSCGEVSEMLHHRQLGAELTETQERECSTPHVTQEIGSKAQIRAQSRFSDSGASHAGLLLKLLTAPP